MMVENQELKIAQARVDTIQQKIEFRAKGKAGNLRNELSKAKAIRNQIASDVNRRGGDLTETKELIEYALEVKEKSKAIAKSMKELGGKIKVFSLYLDYLTKEKTLKEFPEIIISKDFSDIGIKMKQERNLEGALEKAQNFFDRANQTSANRSPVGTTGRTRQLTTARNALNLVKQEVEQFPSLVEFYELRAEKEHLETVIIKKEEQILEMQAYMTELKSESALLEKHGYIEPEMVLI